MSRLTALTVGALFVSGSAWAGRLVFGDTPWPEGAAALVAADSLLLTTIAVVAALLDPGRWVRVLIAFLGVVWAGMAVATDVDAVWAIATGAGILGVAGAWSGPLDTRFAGRIKPDRVPVRATALSLALLTLPGIVGVTAYSDVTGGGWVLAGAGVVVGWAYARAFPAALWVARLLIPIVSVWALIGLSLPAATTLAVVAAVITGLAWTADARLAVAPLVPRTAEAVSILPEMVPGELMEDAGYDRRGRPKESR